METTTPDGGGFRGGGVRPPYHGGIFLQVPGSITVGTRLQLTGCDFELAKSMEEMGVVVTGTWMGGGGFAGVRNILHCGG